MEADSGSVIKIGGAATLSPTSQVNVEVTGTTPGSFGLIAVSGSAALNGTLNVLSGAGVTWSAGDAIQVMTFTSATENFVNVTGTGAGRYLFFVETLGDTAVTLTTSATSEDLAASSLAVGASGTAGQDIDVTYTVDNLSNIAVSGDWFDSVYLTQHTTLDSTAVLLTRVERTSTIAANGSYTVTLSVPLPGLLPGPYYPILFVDSRGLLPDAHRSNNLLVSSSTIQVAVPSVGLGGSVPLTVAAGQSVYYSVAIPAGHDVAFSIAADAAGAAALYVQYAGIVSPSDYEQFAFDPGSPTDEIDLSGATAGTYYILVQGQAAAGSGHSLTLSVHDEPFSIHGVSVSQADTGEPFTVVLNGFLFTPQTTASLVSSTGAKIAAQTVTYISRNTLYATFEVPLFDDGVYGVQVQQGGLTSTLASAITASTQPNSAQATFSMSAPQYVRTNSYGFITISYSNETGHDIPAPLLNVTANNALVRLPDQASFGSNVVQFLGINPSGPAGILTPGAEGQLTIFFQVDVTDPTTGVFFNLYPSLDYFNTGDAGQTQFPMDWASVKDQYRPSSTPVDAWDAIWSNFLDSVGSNVAQFHIRMDIDASDLSQFGEWEYDIAKLVAFELAWANDSQPVATLASVVDASSSTPGISLVFSRQYLQPISGRYQLGPLGRGWVDNWEVSLSVDGQGNVLVTEAGQDRFFTKNADGSYQGGVGDSGQLMESGGVYALRETDGTTLNFNAQGNLASIENPSGDTVTAGYTGGLLTSLSSSDGEVIRIAYDVAGRIHQVTDPAGQVTTYTYDASNELLLSVAGPQGTTSYTYVSGQGIAGQYALASMTFPDGTHQYYSYDGEGRLIRKSGDGTTDDTQYGYPSVGGVTMTTPSGEKTTILYEEFRRPGLIVDQQNQVFQYQYGANYQPVSVSSASGTVFSHANAATHASAR